MKYYLLALNNFANFNGRASRSEYWQFTLINGIINFALSYTESITLMILFFLVTVIPSFAVGVRRMHDVDKSGWLLLIPFVNAIYLLTMGNKGFNNYGPEPI